MFRIDVGKYLKDFIDAIVAMAPRVALTIGIFFIIHIILVSAGVRLEEYLVKSTQKKGGLAIESEKRIRTLAKILRKVAVFLLWGIAGTIVLNQVGIDIKPIITAAGVLGLAVSFGAQNLVRDVISGVFMLLENQLRVGDVVSINGTPGAVEQINLRTIVLRDPAGVVHIFPNGTINSISNMTMDWSSALMDIGVAYRTNLDQAIEVMRKTAEAMRQEPQFKDLILASLEVFGVDKFGDSEITFKVRLKTRPGEQWNVARQYRLRLKKAFDEAGIEIPFPHRSIYFGDASKPIQVLVEQRATEAVKKG